MNKTQASYSMQIQQGVRSSDMLVVKTKWAGHKVAHKRERSCGSGGVALSVRCVSQAPYILKTMQGCGQ